jgi:hypothetical protein
MRIQDISLKRVLASLTLLAVIAWLGSSIGLGIVFAQEMETINASLVVPAIDKV